MPKLSRQRGQTVVEFALLLPLFLFLILFLIEFGFVMYANITVNNTAREAARFAAVANEPGLCDASDSVVTIEDRAVAASANLLTCGVVLPNGDPQVTVNYVDYDGDIVSEGQFTRGDGVVIRIQYEYEMVTPLAELASLPLLGAILPTGFTMRACSDARLEDPLRKDPLFLALEIDGDCGS